MTGRRLAAGAGLAVLMLLAVGAILASVLAPNDPDVQWPDRVYAPPARVHVHDAGGWRSPFVYRLVLEDRLLGRFAEDTRAPVPLHFLTGGRLVSAADPATPLLWLGGDSLGRDVFARLVFGARLSLGVAVVAVVGALVIGSILGGVAGAAGGQADRWITRAADFVLVLPGAYLVLVLRGALPLVLSTAEVFALMATLFAFAAWPHVARGVRAIVATERTRDYAEAARAAGAGPLRVLAHLLPAARGFVLVEVVILIPALLAAEATISFLGLGFPSPTASWGTLLQDAQRVQALASAPWLLAPAVALFVVTFALQLAGGSRAASALTTLVPSGPLTGARTAR